MSHSNDTANTTSNAMKPAKADLLFELGTEELPAGPLQRFIDVLAEEVSGGLEKAGIEFGAVEKFATPRRLALLIRQVQTAQPDRDIEKRGPAVQAALDKEGKPSKAAQGFARSVGVSFEELGRLKTDKGEWLAYNVKQQGANTADLLPEILANALQRLPIPKRMRWGDSDAAFSRPVQWLVVLLGNEVVPCTLLEATADRITHGHRFHAPKPIVLTAPADYEAALQSAHVIASFDKRRDKIRGQVEQEGQSLGGAAALSEDLLDEVTGLVEWPMPISGRIPDEFMQLPSELLITTVREHQRYFPIQDASGKLLPYFITIANIDSRDVARVRTGNERVVKPRLQDALFFWNQDRKQPLASRREALAKVIYQRELGSQLDKSDRVAALAESIGYELGYSAEHVARAAALAKCDLLTDLVFEFTELQGTMGRYYALADGEHADIAQAIEDQYRPRFAGDDLPESKPGTALALADKLDTLASNFSIGKKPTGDRDPFGLRRAALGVLRIIVEQKLPLDLRQLVEQACKPFSTKNLVDDLYGFINDRQRAYFVDGDANVPFDIFDAVQSVEPRRPVDFAARVEALKGFASRPEAASLAAAHKRVNNLLKKAEATTDSINSSLLTEPAEKALYEALAKTREPVAKAAANGDYEDALDTLAALREPVDAFFDGVMVMADDEAVKANRLALLQQLRSQFLAIADVGLLKS